jgi:5'-3' exonuclease
MIVDFLNLCFRYKHANKKVFAAEIISTVQSLGRSYSAKDIVIAGDWGSAWRKNIYPEYKANREELKAKQTPEEQKDFEEFLEEANRALEMMRDQYIVFKFKGVEADDIAAYLCVKYAENYEHVWLISSDKDWDLLIKKNISRFSYITRKEIRLDNWYSHYEYDPELHISIKVLQGDKGDHIPGVDGVGIKRAMSLVEEYGSAYDIYDQLPIDSKYKYIQNLNVFGETILLNYDLMDLETNCDVAIGQENIQTIMETME